MGVEFASDFEAGLGFGCCDQLDDDGMADQGLAAPVAGDEGEQAVLDAVPFACAGRQVAYGDRHAEIVGKLLPFEFPEADARAVAAAAVGGDQQALGVGVAFASHRTPPTADGVDGEGGRVMVDADADPTGVAGDVVDAVRRRASEFGNDEVVDANRSGAPFGRPLRPPPSAAIRALHS